MNIENIRPVDNEDSLTRALNEIEQYFDNEPKRGTPEAVRFQILSSMIRDYEEKVHKIEPLSPLEAISYIMQEH